VSGVDERLARLSPEKRRLLELRLAREGARRAADDRPAGSALPPGDGSPAAGGAMPPRAERPAGPPAERLAEWAADPPAERPSQPPAARDLRPQAAPPAPGRPLAFSLFFFSADGSAGGADRYRLLLDAARFADDHGFAAVWTPERHFVDFGGLYPNPSLLAAALATVTRRVQLRAGSVVLPLHHPVRVAEEWAVVDNLSGGRAAISCASGWHPADFALRAGTWDERKEVMFADLETVRRLWRGETLRLTGGDGAPYEVRSLPRPVQPELPVWVTSAGSTETWQRAGAVGANLLAQIGGQPLQDLARKVELYRAARAAAGHDPAAGIVSLMAHTFVGDDSAEVRRKVRGPLTGYLRTHMKQRDNYLQVPGIHRRDEEALLELAFEHYLSSASLIGTPESCRTMLGRLAAVGVDEVACLVDFGLPASEVMAGLERLAELVAEAAATAPRVAAEQVAR
jgi:natural product biosynthesis luciferase-like monooxygenase protein